MDGLCTERACPHEKVLDPPGLDIFQDSLPDGFPLFLWLDMGRWINRGFGPFHLANWDRYPVDESMGMLEQAKKTVAGGAFLHTLYHYPACDSGGASIGGAHHLRHTVYCREMRQTFYCRRTQINRNICCLRKMRTSSYRRNWERH